MKISKKDLEKKITDAKHESNLETLREIRTYNENYLNNSAIEHYLNSLQSRYIFEYRKKKND